MSNCSICGLPYEATLHYTHKGKKMVSRHCPVHEWVPKPIGFAKPRKNKKQPPKD